MVKSVYQEINGWLHWGASCRIIWWQGLMTVQTELLPSKTLSRLSKCLLSGERLCLVDWFSFLETTVSFMRKEKHNYPLLVSLISLSLFLRIFFFLIQLTMRADEGRFCWCHDSLYKDYCCWSSDSFLVIYEVVKWQDLIMLFMSRTWEGTKRKP